MIKIKNIAAAMTAAFLALGAVIGMAGAQSSTDGLHGIGFSKGCTTPSYVNQEYKCAYSVANTIDTGNNTVADTLTVTSIVDVVHANPSDVTSANLLPLLSLTLAGGATCNGGQTLCTLPPGASITSAAYGSYTIDGDDPNPISDTATLTWQDLCTSGAQNCPIGNQLSIVGSQSPVLKNPSTTATKILDANNIDITNTTVLSGVMIHDQATVTGSYGTATGTVDFTLYPNSTCTAPSGSVQTGLALSAGVTNSGALATTGTGMSYIAHYSGDSVYDPSDGPCEPLTVTNPPHLTVIKHVINDNGGAKTASDFSVAVTGTNATPATFSGVESPGTAVSLSAGAYSVTETTDSGYAATYSADCSGTIANGDSKTCTITNNDIAPHLTLSKVVVNGFGGTAIASNWTLSATGPVTISGAGTATSGNDFMAGTYTLAETGPTGYLAGPWVCTGATISGSNIDQLVLGLGVTATCTITNTQPTPQVPPPVLTVIKHVINDDGGTKTASNFQISVTGTNVDNTSFPGAESPGTIVHLSAGSFNVTEATDSGYAATYSADCSGTINDGDSKICTITNNDIAKVYGTRTQGFWQTHTAFTSSIFQNQMGDSMTVGSHTITSAADLFGGFYASISKTSTGAKRSTLDQDKMILVQQLIAAELNCAAFGCSTSTQNLISQANTDLAGSSASAILADAQALDAYNGSGEAVSFPNTVPAQGSATPKASQSAANIAFWDSP